MRQILVSALVGLAVAIMLTPLLVRLFTRYRLGQEIRGEGPRSHQAKRGTPTMGGIAILAGTWAGYLAAHLISGRHRGDHISMSGLLVLALTTALGLVGFLDDFIKLRNRRNLGLTAKGKYLGQLAAAVIFAVLVLRFPDGHGLTPAGRHLSGVRDIGAVSFPVAVFVLVVCFLVVAWSNAVNVTDGLDGLAAGSMSFTVGAYVIITFWQYINSCATAPAGFARGCYEVRDPLDLAVLAAAGGAACVGFLWWNAAPAKIFMGDTGSLALGGLLAGLSITSRTELLTALLGALFCTEIASVLIQIVVFRSTKHRVFRMAPLHHHFELGGWDETTVIIRFWILSGIAAALGMMLFYGEYLTAVG